VELSPVGYLTHQRITGYRTMSPVSFLLSPLARHLPRQLRQEILLPGLPLPLEGLVFLAIAGWATISLESQILSRPPTVQCEAKMLL